MPRRNFLPSDGLFELEFPFDWTYKLSHGHIHQFNFIKGIGSFHFSVLGEAARESFNRIKKNPKSIKRSLGKTTAYEFTVEADHKFHTTVWHLEKGGTIFLASNTYSAKYKNTKQFSEERKIIFEILRSLKIIPPDKREQCLAWFKFGKFTDGLAASEKMLNNATKNGCFIECVCLLANQIDGMLRVANILFDQIQSKSNDVNTALIYQGEKDKRITEKDIYKLSKDKGIIDEKLFDELYLVYEDRNRVVHRYIISEITTRDILDIASTYSTLKRTLWQIVYNLESKQIELGLGMTESRGMIPDEKLKESKKIFDAAVFEKLGGIDLDDKPQDK